MVEMTKNKYVDTKGEWAEWEGLGDWDWHAYTIDPLLKQVTNENILYSTGNSI